MTADTSAQDYWKEKYDELPPSLGPIDTKDINKVWAQLKGLRYGGQDGGGDFWIGRDGTVYHFDDKNDSAASDNSDTGINRNANNGNSWMLTNNNPVLYKGNVIDTYPVNGRTSAASNYVPQQYVSANYNNAQPALSGQYSIPVFLPVTDTAGIVTQKSSVINTSPFLNSKSQVLAKEFKQVNQPLQNNEKQTIETIFIDESSGKYLGHLNDYVDTDENYSFPKLHINVRSIAVADFNGLKNKSLSLADPTYPIPISTPIQIKFDNFIKNIVDVVTEELNYDNEGRNENPHLEVSLYIIFFKETYTIDTVTLPFARINLHNAAFSTDVFACQTSIASYYVTSDNYKEAEDYFIKENKLTDPVYLMTRDEIDEKRPLKYPGESRLFFDKVATLEQYVICDCHTHPNIEKIDPYNTGHSMSIRYLPEPSNEDKQHSASSHKPEIVLQFYANPSKTKSDLREVYFISQHTTGKYDYMIEGNSSQEILQKLKNNIQELFLDRIIKKYYYGNTQPD